MNNENGLFSHLTNKVVEDAMGWKLCAYLVALEGWRRGLTLKWYKAETDMTTIKTIGKSAHGKIFSLSSKNKTHFYFRSRGDGVSNKAVDICNNKEKTKNLLSNAGIPVPKGRVFRKDTFNEEMIKYAKNIGFPVVLKPTNGSMGKGVFSNIENEEDLKNALQNLREERYSNYIIEKYFPGKEYRIYVVGDQVIGAINRIPANVKGDGLSTFKELIEKKNKERLKNPYLAKKPIKIDYEITKILENAGYTIDSVPSEGENILLRQKSNLSSGGDPLDATDGISDEIKKIAIDSLKAIPNLAHAGVDVIVDPGSEKKGTTIEINPTAEIGFHLFPLLGQARDIPGAIIDYYFPETIDTKRTNHYFDFKSVLEPLRTRSVNEIEVANPSLGETYGKRYIISGKPLDTKYMHWLKRKALKKNLSGFVKKLKRGKVEVVVTNIDPKEVEEFTKVCRKGPKSTVINDYKETEWDNNCPLKLGFDIRD